MTFRMRRRFPLPVRRAPQSQLFLRWLSIAGSSSLDWRQVVADFQRKATDSSASLLPQDVERVVRVCTQSDRTREALDVVHKAEKRGVTAPLKSHVQICCSWARKGQAERALQRMPELHARFGPQFQSASTSQSSVYDPLLSVFKLQGDWRSTHAAIAQMHELGLTPTLRAFRVLMLTAAKARRTDTLLTTAAFVEKKFPGLWTDVATLTAMCQALLDAGENRRVMEIYRKLNADWVHEQASTMLFNQFLLAAMRSGCAKDGKKRKERAGQEGTPDMKVAMDIFHRMQEACNADPDDFTFATCMMELQKRGEWSQVLDLFKTMLDTQTRNESNSKAVINALSCSAAIRALHKLHQSEQLGQEKSDQQDTRAQPSSKSPTKSNDQHGKLKQDLSVVLKQIHTISLQHIGHASTLIDTLDQFKLFTAARQTFKRMLDEGVIQKTPWRLKDGFEIDLHTFSRGVAKCAVVSAFEEITRSQQGMSDVSLPGNAPLQDLRIITGVGKRSQTFMKPVLRQEVTELLTKSGRPPLWPSSHPTNPGVLLVRHNALRKWLQKGGAIRYF